MTAHLRPVYVNGHLAHYAVCSPLGDKLATLPINEPHLQALKERSVALQELGNLLQAQAGDDLCAVLPARVRQLRQDLALANARRTSQASIVKLVERLYRETHQHCHDIVAHINFVKALAQTFSEEQSK